MNKLVKVAVSASLSTDFYIEVPEEATKDEIKEVASKEIIIPTDYPKYLHSFLEQHFNIPYKYRNINDIVKTLSIENQNIVGGQTYEGVYKYGIRTKGEFKNINDIEIIM